MMSGMATQEAGGRLPWRSQRVAIPEDELRRLYCDQGLSITAIGALKGCSPTAVRNQLVRNGIPRRLPWQAVTCDVTEVSRLYADERLSLFEVAEQVGCSEGVVRRRLMAAGINRRLAWAPRLPRRDFGGDRLDKAYLIGFRLGDLHVAQGEDTVLIKCTSTREEQVALFRSLFEPYGQIYTREAAAAYGRRPSVRMEDRLNRSFDFLLPKGDFVPEWILEVDGAFFAFFAGYLDAEGYVKTRPPHGGRALEVHVEIRSYDRRVLQQLRQGLDRRGIVCPDVRLRVAAGYTNRSGVRSNKDTWGLGIGRTDALLRLFERISPYVRHAKRHEDMNRAWAVITGRMTSARTVRRLAVTALAKRHLSLAH
jgi:hypothetical protein